MKIFLAVTSLLPAYGGPAFSISRLAMALSTAGVDIGLWAADQSAPSTSLLPGDTAVLRLGGSLKQAMRRFGKVDVVHDNGLWLFHHHRTALLCSRNAIPRVISTRGMLEPWARAHKKFKKDIAWRLYQKRDLTTSAFHHVTAEAEAKSLECLGLGVPIRTIPNGVDIPHHEAEPPIERACARTALFLGRLYPVKGLPMLVEAWARVRPQGWRLQIAGPDEAGHRSEVERAIASFGLGDIISFLGPVSDSRKSAAFLHADLFILPTHSESFGMAIAEALAHGLPVLTTMGAPWPALTEHGCGWRTSISVDGLADGLRKATTCNSEVLRAMGMRGRTFVSRELGWDRIAQQFLQFYEDARVLKG